MTAGVHDQVEGRWLQLQRFTRLWTLPTRSPATNKDMVPLAPQPRESIMAKGEKAAADDDSAAAIAATNGRLEEIAQRVEALAGQLQQFTNTLGAIGNTVGAHTGVLDWAEARLRDIGAGASALTEIGDELAAIDRACKAHSLTISGLLIAAANKLGIAAITPADLEPRD